MSKGKPKYRQWHPMFVKSIEVALKDAQPGQLEIIPEVSLSSKPLDIDVLVIINKGEPKLKHPISRIFRRYNVIEYKSPEDYLAPEDFDKALVYARWHQVLENPKQDLQNQYSISCISSTYPRAMMQRIRDRGLIIEKHNPTNGLYQVRGEMYPIQVVVLNQIDNPEYLWPFSPYIDEKKRRQNKAFVTLFMECIRNPADRNIRDLLEFSGRNTLFTLEEWKEVWNMGKRELSQEELKEYFDAMDPVIAERWRKESMKKGIKKGIELTALNLISMELTDDDIVKATELPLKRIEELRNSLH